MNRARIVEGLNLESLRGMEFGPLDRPVVQRADGRVTYVDHVSTDELRHKYASDPGVDVAALAEIDAVWGARTLREALPHDARFDYAIASHVMEHVPDLIGWLLELEGVLTGTGELRLVLPDRRFTFDYLRGESTPADIMDAYIRRQRVPSLHAIFDHFLNHREVDCATAWDEALNLTPYPTRERFQMTVEAAWGSLDGLYSDAHCWVFTPRSFAGLLRFACHFNLVPFACERLYDTERTQLEFYAHLRVCHDFARAAGSWRDAAAGLTGREDRVVTGLREELEAAREELDTVRETLNAARAELLTLRRSTSWRVTAPLRRAATALRR